MAKKKENEEKIEEAKEYEFDFSAIAKSVDGVILNDIEPVKYWIDTGVLAFNYVSCEKFIGGGIPVGRVVELYGDSASGKSLIGMNILRGCQAAGGVAVLLDVEKAVSKDFAIKASHINPKRLIVMEGDTLNECFAKIRNVITTAREAGLPMSKPIVIIYDSIAASPSDREFAETTVDMVNSSAAAIKAAGAGTDQPGDRAKICSKQFRLMPSFLSKNNATLVVINQIRQKIGVMFGCHFGGSKVYLSNGKVRRIKDIVKNKESVDVLSYNSENGNIESKKVIGWHDNGLLSEGENFLKIKFKRRFRRPYGYLQCTKNHNIFKYDDCGEIVEVQAGSIVKGDKLALIQPFYLTQDQFQIVYGSVLGDGELRVRSNRNAQLRFGHGRQQHDYINYKYSLMKSVMAGPIRETNHDSYESETKPLYEINHLAQYKKDYMIPQEIADNLNELGLAIWYMDDGTYSGHNEKWGNGRSVIYCKKFHNREIMLQAFERLGLVATIFDKGFKFDSENTLKFHQLIARFVPEGMSYKLHPRYQGLYDFSFEYSKEVEYKTISGEVLDIEIKKTDLRRKYDLTVEGNSTYIVSGALVHNSNETGAGGGRALEYYASSRFRLRSNKTPKDDKGNILGVNVSVTNSKNRCARPHQDAKNMYLFFEQGINPFGGLLELMIKNGRIKSTSAGNYVVNEPWADGREIKFKSNKERNDIPLQTLLDCPKLIDAEKPEQVQYYADLFGSAIEMTNHGIASEEDFQEE